MGEIVRFPFEETLDEYTKSYHDNDEYTRLFYVMDSTMKYLHDNGYYVINFNPKNIIVGFNNDTCNFVNFNSIDVIDDDKTNKVNNNIYNLAFLEIGLLSETLNYLRPDFLKQNFSQFKIFIPENLVNYYQMILVNGGHHYLSEYLEVKNKQEITKLTKSLEEEGGTSRGKSYVKSNGNHYEDEDKVTNNDDITVFPKLPRKKDNDIAAFVTNYALAFAILASSLLIPIIAFLVGRS